METIAAEVFWTLAILRPKPQTIPDKFSVHGIRPDGKRAAERLAEDYRLAQRIACGLVLTEAVLEGERFGVLQLSAGVQECLHHDVAAE
jgi:hypothetical protein